MKQAERRAGSLALLMGAARTLFVERGYFATSVDEITAQAGLTKGAFYHHFKDKQAVFQIVFEALQEELTVELMRSSKASNAWAALRKGCHVFLDVSLQSRFHRIIFKDGPQVLGRDLWREIDHRYALGMVIGALEAAASAGYIQPRPFKALAQLLLGALCEASLEIAAAENPKAVRKAFIAEIDILLDGLALENVSA